MPALRMWSSAVLLLSLAFSAQACVHQFGEPDVPNAGGTEWTYDLNGDDWVGQDANNVSWVCATGLKQSPINLPDWDDVDGPRIPNALKTLFSYKPLQSNGSNVQVINNGHTIQVQWTGDLQSKVQIATANNTVTDLLTLDDEDAQNTTRVLAIPKQFHFHSTSEHLANGEKAVLELHIVHNIPQSSLPGCAAGGCFAVVGTMLALRDGPSNPFLDTILDVAPTLPGQSVNLDAGKVLDLEKYLPASKDYITYEGSLTTPPCSEGLLWHVFTTPLYITPEQFLKYRRAVGRKLCDVIGPDGEEVDDPDDNHDDRRRRKMLSGGSSTSTRAASSKNEIVTPRRQLLGADPANYDPLAKKHSRSLLDTDDTPSNVTYVNCTVTDYISNYRLQQPLNARIVRASVATKSCAQK